MAVSGYLAMTPEQLHFSGPPSGPLAWMSCRFAGSILEALPGALPPGSLLILEDSRLPEQPDMERILASLRNCLGRLRCSGLLLDFQRPEEPVLRELVRSICGAMPCPVAVTEAYAGDAAGPVFLSLIPPHQAPEEALRPWSGRELWLELGPGFETALVTETASEFSPALPEARPGDLQDASLLCHYRAVLKADQARITLYRSREDLLALLARAEALGVTRYAGLLQDRKFLP